MYYVYEITKLGHHYIGCTNDLRRRKDQHNENARKRKSKLGVFLDDNNIVLKDEDLVVIGIHDNRKDALIEERAITKHMDREGASMLNDNYIENCSRKGKHLGNTTKEYYIIDFITHTATYTNDLRQYCTRNGINYKLVQRTTKGLRYTKSGYKVFFKADWESESDKDLFLYGGFVELARQEQSRGISERQGKLYEVKCPDGHSETVRNLDRFAREHNLTSGTLHATLIKGKPTKGYQVLRRI